LKQREVSAAALGSLPVIQQPAKSDHNFQCTQSWQVDWRNPASRPLLAPEKQLRPGPQAHPADTQEAARRFLRPARAEKIAQNQELRNYLASI
jgi:hypothetical protein